jgi:hypothetical protein
MLTAWPASRFCTHRRVTLFEHRPAARLAFGFVVGLALLSGSAEPSAITRADADGVGAGTGVETLGTADVLGTPDDLAEVVGGGRVETPSAAAGFGSADNLVELAGGDPLEMLSAAAGLGTARHEASPSLDGLMPAPAQVACNPGETEVDFTVGTISSYTVPAGVGALRIIVAGGEAATAAAPAPRASGRRWRGR